MTSATGQPGSEQRRRDGFTLMELILVLALLVVTMSLVTPRLAGFTSGRALDSEARRLLALSHAAGARAVAEGVRVSLWLNPEEGTYGVEKEPTLKGEEDPDAQEFAVDEDVRLDATALGAVGTTARNLPAIRFLPDGTIAEDSPETIRLLGKADDVIELVQVREKSEYEIATPQP